MFRRHSPPATCLRWWHGATDQGTVRRLEPVLLDVVRDALLLRAAFSRAACRRLISARLIVPASSGLACTARRVRSAIPPAELPATERLGRRPKIASSMARRSWIVACAVAPLAEDDWPKDRLRASGVPMPGSPCRLDDVLRRWTPPTLSVPRSGMRYVPPVRKTCHVGKKMRC